MVNYPERLDQTFAALVDPTRRAILARLEREDSASVSELARPFAIKLPAVMKHLDALTTPEGIACWGGPDDGPVLLAETDLRVGGRFRVRFRMLDGSEHESSGEYLEVVRPERLAMSWRWTGGEEDPGESLVEIELRAVAEGTELTFTHSRLHDEESRRSHEEGWTGAL